MDDRGDAPITLDDYEAAALARLPTMVADYYAGGAGEERTLRENRAAFARWTFRPRVLVDVSNVELATTVLGAKVPFPILVAPTAFHRLADTEGEVATAKGVLATGTTMVVSTIASVRLEDVAETGADRWFQLYVFRDRELTSTLVKRAYGAGYRAIVLTVDTPLLGTRYRDERNRFQLPDGVGLANLAVSDLPPEDEAGRPGSSLSHFFAGEHDASLSWADLPWLRSLAPLPLVLKGIVTAEDARLAVAAGVDGIVVSNHGGRQLDGAPATLDALPEVVEAVAGRAEVYLDGGVRRGSDVLTALALGAKAVFVGRPVLWGLAVDGAAGVTAVLEMLRDELRLAMQLTGTPSVASITRSLVGPAVRSD
ncbi:MAG: alpha-hydroxy-acid oxidizing protein [Actinobacteria bacterium]|nr:MAG: alpha-hydroxy-acid oxidizing protein [Actinomycetota bacterium]